MKQLSMALVLILATGCTTTGGGGGGGGGGPVETSLVLNEGLGTFDVQAGVPAQRTGTVTFRTSSGNLQGGTIELSPAALNIESAAGAKNAVLLQGGEVTVTVWVATIEDVETVCETGEEYGPYTVTLDENNQPVSVDPNTVQLTETTLDLLVLGEFSICIEVVSPIDATVTIQSFQISLDF